MPLPSTPIVIATRRSPLALAQTRLVVAHLAPRVPAAVFELLEVVTTGDARQNWSLERQGGKGLFTAEIEEALRRGEAHLAVHSTKDLPGADAGDLVVAGYLPREDPRDVLVMRTGVDVPATIATSSPRRRLQVARLFPTARFVEIRGNVDTRLRKIAAGQADATLLAQAGLSRLGLATWPGVSFQPLDCAMMVPAVGQGAVAVQCPVGAAPRWSPHFDGPTARSVAVERALQARLGGGCQIAFGAHLAGATFHVFHEHTGSARFDYRGEPPAEFAEAVVQQLGLS
jgi:hydroxymethylbilane synthase